MLIVHIAPSRPAVHPTLALCACECVRVPLFGVRLHIHTKKVCTSNTLPLVLPGSTQPRVIVSTLLRKVFSKYRQQAEGRGGGGGDGFQTAQRTSMVISAISPSTSHPHNHHNSAQTGTRNQFIVHPCRRVPFCRSVHQITGRASARSVLHITPLKSVSCVHAHGNADSMRARACIRICCWHTSSTHAAQQPHMRGKMMYFTWWL